VNRARTVTVRAAPLVSTAPGVQVSPARTGPVVSAVPACVNECVTPAARRSAAVRTAVFDTVSKIRSVWTRQVPVWE
jgi:hypothetical protein